MHSLLLLHLCIFSMLTHLAWQFALARDWAAKVRVGSQSILSTLVSCVEHGWLLPFHGVWSASSLDPRVWSKEVKALYSMGTGKTLTSLSCMLWLTAFSRSEILIVLSSERAPALASSVSNQGRNCAKDLFVFCWMEYRLHLMVLPSVLILYLASISHPLYLEQVLSNSES
jgi:hypothetical protein